MANERCYIDGSFMIHANPLVSVLVCNYNYGKYIDEALDSILLQDYKNIEVIIVDDGSRDDSVKLIQNYIDKHPEVTFSLKVKSKNEGLCYARNDAIEMAKGEYFVFLDSDDSIPINYITKLYKTAIESKADIVYGDVKNFGSESGETKAPEFNAEELLIHNYISISSLVKKSKIKDHRFDVELNRKTLEDYDFWMGLALMGLKFVKAKDVFLNYRIQGLSRNENDAPLVTRILNFIEIWQYSIDKYKKIYPEKIKSDIVVEELKFQIKEIGHELVRLNSVVQGDLVPELKRREEHIEHLNSRIVELERSNDELVNSVERRVGIRVLKPIRAIKRRLSR